ncbi:carboxymuconolactone decarboxylase family protein [Paeniglutamicibacter sulfureus]|uniref:Alkylhydroperoxidase/carboxymuconolactone decarboxylase family protein YurZ n=1 Tax=Paeniglutamicibacter sulfureus TaxID=43666 RepID=A0ABU2BLF3_9MICC|nr:carboxymuconolactone decarboxylase family protein [Paeniglutamicibacter sulfureus]MDR7358799.1 alkylhydroperoxidase/carboxymuconolactone decarboxylase family protein YurZ [Paeniglutamicibacter sulfureus]
MTTNTVSAQAISPTQLREDFERLHGRWDERLQALLELNPRMFEVHAGLVGVSNRQGVLSEKIGHLVHLAVAAAATHLYGPGTEGHIRGALRAGATEQEIAEVLQLTGTLGIHAHNVGGPILEKVLRETGNLPQTPEPLTEHQHRLKASFEARRGFWHEDFEQLLRLDPDLFEAYCEYSGLPWTEGELEPKVREFIYIAFDVAATHLHRPGIEQHFRNALRHGATAQELLAVLQIASTLGTHGVLEGALAMARVRAHESVTAEQE